MKSPAVVLKRVKALLPILVLFVVIPLLFLGPLPNASASFQSTSTNFGALDPIMGIFGNFGTSTSFLHTNAGGQTITGIATSTSFTVRFGFLYFDAFTPRSQNWRWYSDVANETPTTALAAENTAPVDIDNQQSIKLRITIKETAGIGSANQKFTLQYSTMSDFSEVNNVEEIVSCAAASSTWCYANGGGNDNVKITTSLISDAGSCSGAIGAGCGTHNTSSLSVSSFSAPGDGATEYEFTIKNAGGSDNVTYFFRAFDATNNAPVSLGAGKTNPSLAVKGAFLVFSIGGLPAATSTQGIVTDVATTPAAIPFSALSFDNETEAAQRLTVTASSTEGYQIFILQDQGFVSGPSEIVPVSAANDAPNAWAIPSGAGGAFGYHAGDPILSGGSTRFAPNNTYAKLETAAKEIVFAGAPVTNESTDIVFKVQVTNQQEAADYAASIMYIIVPTF